jgi:hypothetical protein
MCRSHNKSSSHSGAPTRVIDAGRSRSRSADPAGVIGHSFASVDNTDNCDSDT